MKNKVYEKFEKELQKDIDNRTLMVISDYLLKLCDDINICEKLLQPGKSLNGAVKVMQEEAKKIQKNNMAVFSFEEGIEIVEKYFDIPSKSQTFEKPKTAIQKKSIFDLI